MDGVGGAVPGNLGPGGPAELAGDLAELADQVVPLADAHVVEVLGLHAAAERVAGEVIAGLVDVVPQLQRTEKVTGGVLEAGVLLVGLGLLLEGAFSHVLDGHGSDDDDDGVELAEAVGLDEHPCHAGVDGDAGDVPAGLGEDGLAVAFLVGEGPEFVQQEQAVADGAVLRRLDEGELGDVTQPHEGHLQDDAGQVGAQDLGVGELGAGVEVLLRVQADGDAVGDTAAATGALVGRGLRDRFDGQALYLVARGVPRDAGGAGVHHVPDAGHRQRGLGDVRRQDDAPAGVRLEHSVLLLVGQATEERGDLHALPLPSLDRLHGVADVTLTGEETEDVAGALEHELLARLAEGVERILVDDLAVAFELHGPVADLHGEGAAGDLDDGGWFAVGVGEVVGEGLRVNRGGGDDHLEVRSLRQQAAQVAEDEVDVEGTLVGLVDDEGVVGVEEAVALHLRQQDAVGHELDGGGGGDAVVETDGVADGLADVLPQLLGDALGDGAGRQAARLRVTDEPAAATPQVEADLRDLGGLAGAGLTGDDDDLVVLDRLRDVLAPRGHGQGLGVGDLGDAGVDELLLHDGAVEVRRNRGERLRRAGLVEAAAEGALVGKRDVLEAGVKIFTGSHG